MSRARRCELLFARCAGNAPGASPIHSQSVFARASARHFGIEPQLHSDLVERVRRGLTPTDCIRFRPQARQAIFPGLGSETRSVPVSLRMNIGAVREATSTDQILGTPAVRFVRAGTPLTGAFRARAGIPHSARFTSSRSLLKTTLYSCPSSSTVCSSPFFITGQLKPMRNRNASVQPRAVFSSSP